MALTRDYQKTISNTEKFTTGLQDLAEITANFVKWGALGSTITVYLDTDFTTAQETALDAYVANFVDFTTSESLKIYLDGTIFPFIDNLITTFAAENMATGITQAGKTGEVLGLFSKKYDVESNGLPISLKDTFDTGSLYESIAVIAHIRANPTEFTGLDPYISDTKLLGMLNAIEAQLGLTLST